MICGMIKTLALDCTATLVCSKNEGKTVVEAASNEMLMGAVRVLCKFSLHVSQQHHSDLLLNAPDDVRKQISKKKSNF